MSPEQFHRECEDLLVFGPCCPMSPGLSEPYAVHRDGEAATMWMMPSASMSGAQRAEQIETIKDRYGLPSAELLMRLHPGKNRAAELIAARAHVGAGAA